MGLYEQIRDVAKERGYSINRLEKELGFARSSINKFNKNMPSAEKVQQIADFLHVSVDYLMTGESDNKYSEDKARLAATAVKDKQLQRMLQYFMGLNPAKKDMVEQMLKMLSENEESSK